MSDKPAPLLARLRYCQAHGLFDAAAVGMDASYGEAADTIEQLLEALRPFALAADNWNGEDDVCEIICVSAKHFLAASAAIAKATGAA